MNNNEKLLSNHDIYKFVESQHLSHNCFYLEEELTSIDQLFPGTNNFAVIWLRNPGTHIGHFVLCINNSTETKKDVEYFDCLGNKPSLYFHKLVKGSDWHIYYNDIPLMGKTNVLCGKYCISRLLCRNKPLATYIDMLKSNKKYTPDELIDFFYQFQIT